jgi:hypothetical protein
MIVRVRVNDGECGSFVVTLLVEILCLESIPMPTIRVEEEEKRMGEKKW